MAFLAPLFLAGLAALALPVLLHLQKNRPKETVAFSSLMFLEESPLTTKTRSRLQDLLLLMLRCLAVILLVLAFARPFFPTKNESVVSDEGTTMNFILIDSSASMRGEASKRASELAGNLIKEISAKDWIALASYSDQLRPLLGPERARQLTPDERKSAALSLLPSIEADWKSSELDAALLAALSAAGKDSLLKIHVVGDLQKGSSLEGLRGEVWPPNAQVIVHAVAPENGWTNAAVRILPVKDQTQRARVSNSQGSQKSEFVLAWGDALAPIQVSVPPGESAIFVAPEGLAKEGEVTLIGDDYSYDNQAFWITPELPVARVWCPNQSQATDTKEGAYFLSRALQSTSEYTVEITAEQPKEEPALTIIDAEAEVKELLSAGGVVLFPLRDAASANKLSAIFGSRSGEVQEAEVGGHVLFGEIDFKSTVFAPFADERYSDFSRIRVWKYRVLPEELIAKGEVLASFDSGDPAWVSFPVGKGTLHVMSTTWRPVDSQLALTTKFPPLLHSLLSQGLGEDRGVGPVYPNEIYESPGIQREGDSVFVVQLDPAESERTPLLESELRSLGLPLDPPKDLLRSAEIAEQISHAELEARQRVSWWFLVIAAAFFLAETIIAGFSSKRQTPVTT